MDQLQELAGRYFECSKLGLMKVERCSEMRTGQKKRSECRGCKQFSTLTMDNTTLPQIEAEAAEFIEKNPERRIKDLRQVGWHLNYMMRNRR